MTFRGAGSAVTGAGGRRGGFGAAGGVTGMPGMEGNSPARSKKRSKSDPHHNSPQHHHGDSFDSTWELEPRDMDLEMADQIKLKYEHKVDATKFELVASFIMDHGHIAACHVYRERMPFQLTERRRRLLTRYYSQGVQTVALYVNRLQFEHYMPLGSLHSVAKWRQSTPSSPAGGHQSILSKTRGTSISSVAGWFKRDKSEGNQPSGGSVKMTRTGILQRNTTYTASL